MDILEMRRLKRKEKGLTQYEMAKLLKLPRTAYQNIENNTITLKVYDFLKIIEILDIPLAYFTDEHYVVISEDDFSKLKKAANEITQITERIESNVNVVNNSKVVNMNFTNEGNKKRFCEICGEPLGFFPLCKYHSLLKEKRLVYKNKNGYWVEK